MSGWTALQLNLIEKKNACVGFKFLHNVCQIVSPNQSERDTMVVASDVRAIFKGKVENELLGFFGIKAVVLMQNTKI